MAGIIPSRLEPSPDPRATYVARPLYGRVTSAYGNNQSYLGGFRGLRYISQQCEWEAAALYDEPPVGAMVNEPRMRFVVSPLAKYVWWGANISAVNTAPTGQILKLHVETPAGVVIDGPFEWTNANGRLPTGWYGGRIGGGEKMWGITEGRDLLASTGWETVAGGATPRLIDVSNYQGLDVVLRVETVAGVRVYSHFALEAYRPEL